MGRYYRKGSDDPVLGTSETVTACYSITRDPTTGKWTYDGAGYEIFDEGAEPDKAPNGEPPFLTVGGDTIAESEIEWRDG